MSLLGWGCSLFIAVMCLAIAVMRGVSGDDYGLALLAAGGWLGWAVEEHNAKAH